MRKITVMNGHSVYVGNEIGWFNTCYVLEKYKCCGFSGYGVDIYYDADAKMPSEYMWKIATKKALKERIRETKKHTCTLRTWLSCCKDKEERRKEYFAMKENNKRLVKEIEALLADVDKK